MKKALYACTLLCLFASSAYAEDHCRSWRLPPSHVLYFRDIDAVRIEFPRKSRPHSLIRIHFGRCDLQRYVEMKVSAAFWSDLAEKAIGFSPICTSETPCSEKYRTLLESLDSLQQQFSSQESHLFLQENSSSSFYVLFCLKKQHGLLIQCKMVRPDKNVLGIELIEESSLPLYDTERFGKEIVAVGSEGILRRKGRKFQFQPRQGSTSFSFSSGNVRNVLPRPLSRHSRNLASLLKVLPTGLASLLVLSRKTWWERFKILSEPKLWIFLAPLERSEQGIKP